MPHKRERFERTDVPRPSHVRTIVSLVVLLVVAGGLYWLVTSLWTRANLETHLGDKTLGSSVSSQAELADLTGEYVLSQDTFQNVLVLTASSLDDDAVLVSAELLVIDVNAHSAVLASIPVTVSVTYAGADVMLADLYQSEGASACVTAVGSAANVRLSHAVVATSDVWERVSGLSGAGVNSIVTRGSSLLADIYTDMSSQDLLDLAELVQSIGVAHFTHVEAPVYEQTSAAEGSEAETVLTRLDQQALNVAVGILLPAPAEESEADAG